MDDTADLDTNAFLQSVRELKEKRQREDNERQEQLEAQIASSRLARKLERERDMTTSPPASPSMSPQKASPSSALPSRANTFSRQPRSRPMSVDMGSPTRASSVRPMSMMSIPEQGAALPSRDSQRFAPPDVESAGVGRTMSNAQSRLDRPASPTKGMGGFVQSAMLKRTDSVNKRWSTTAGPSTLSRHDSTASFRSTTNADDTESRPTSSHSTISNLNIAPESDVKEKPERPVITRHSRSRSMASFSGQEPIPEGLMSPPLSPNKRWSRSPTKASWLESALSRPESPKPLASPQTNQPSWMAEITKAKQQRGTAENSQSQDNTDATKVQEIPAFGQSLLKKSSVRNTPGHSPTTSRNVTPPTKAKPASLVGKSAPSEPSAPTLDPTPKEPEKTEPEKQETTKETPVESEPAEDKASEEPEETTVEEKPLKPAPLKSSAFSSAPSLPPKPQLSDSLKSPPSSSSPKFPTLKSPDLQSSEFKQETTPKIDFRSGLKSRSGTVSTPSQKEQELRTKSPELKQDTTPKTDFRAGLKSRSGTIGAASQEQPEFKALFGKLKKAQTEKYVAPDELKNNILRGKAGLNLSAGPQKSERRDELKESLQKRKEEMNKAAAEKPAEPKISNAPSAVPEALTIRKQLGRSNSTLNVPAPEKSRRDITPEALSFHKNLRGKPKAPEKRSSVTEKFESKRASTDAPSSAVVVPDEKPAEEEAAPTKEAELPEPEKQELPKLEKREPPKTAKQELPKPEKQESSTKPEKQEQIRPQSNKFADRFNPALAGLLARGPPQSNSGSPRSGSPFSPSTTTRPQTTQDQEPEEGTQLTHMTKGRAKGPKRRKPKSSATPNTTTSTTKITPEKRISSFESAKIEEPPTGSPATKTPVQPRPKSAAVRAASINLSKPPAAEPEKPKTPTPTKVSLSTPSSAQSDKAKTPTPAKPALATPSPVQSEKTKAPASIKSSLEAPASAGSDNFKPPTPAKPVLSTPSSIASKAPIPAKVSLASPSSGSPLSTKPIQNAMSPLSATRKTSGLGRPLPVLPSLNNTVEKTREKPLPPVNTAEANKENQSFSSVKNAASMWGRSAQQTPTRKSGPIELPTKKDEEAAMISAGLLSSSPMRYKASPPKLGLGISEDNINPPKRANGNEQTPPSSAGAPPKPAKSSRVVSGQLSAKDLPRVPDVLQLPAGRDLNDFFGEVPKSHNELQLNTDTQTVLRSRSGESDRIKTLRSSISEIKPDGTLVPLPAQQEHILYENSMYICSHIFYTENMSRMAEVYLWCGDGISESMILDTQVHAKRLAREAGVGQKSTQLYIIDQAREPANFFQALGGIVITRRGSRAESSTSPYMLCGRPHMGHIAFDEVDRSKASLCSEYPYIVARPVTLQETKVWLWKGSGCGPAAIGSARLISMDLNPGGGFTEVDEGRETSDFLMTIRDPDKDICKSPAMWSRANAAWEHSHVRLFRVETSAPRQTATSLFTSFISRRPSWSAPRSPNGDRPGSSSSNKSNSGASEFEASISEIAPFTQEDLEPEGCYILDAGSAVLVLPGPLLSKTPLWQHAFTQAALFAHDYAILSASLEDRPAIPRAAIVLGGLPREAKVKFRRWEEKRGLWGTGGMMAGKKRDDSGALLDVREALEVCCGL